VDLVRFELTTSSMPFKKYQSLTDTSTRNKRLNTGPRGLRWTPRGGFLGGLDSTRTPGLHRGWHGACFPARAVAGCSICRLPKETIGFHISRFPYKDDAHVERWEDRALELKSEHSPL
jgi:hypothetical protein